MLIGAHVSNSGGLEKAVARGVERGADAIQIFNQSPRMWRPTAYAEDDFAAFREAMAASPIQEVVIHAVYLLNCASEDKDIRAKSRASLIQSLRVADGVEAAGVVLHPGSAKTGDVPKAIKRAGEVISQALSQSEHSELLLEDTAGAGGTLGRSFDELAALLEAAGAEGRVGVCLDSCHLYASGYDIKSEDGLRTALEEFESAVGLDRLRSLHLNDSMSALGSNRDRHALLGEGELGEAGCSVFLSEPRFEKLPCLLETGRDGGAPAAQDLAKARELRERGLRARRRKRGKR